MRLSKIGIFLPGQHGDIMSAMSVLKYKDRLWPGKEIIWFCATPRSEVLKFNDAITEVRHWPEGYGLPERCVVDGPQAVAKGEPMWEDFSVLKTANNRLNQALKYNFESTKDLEEGYFPAPWMMSVAERDGIEYPNISRKIFGADPSWEWHPYLGFSNEEREMVKEFCSTLPHKKTVMMETFLGSGAHQWSDDMTKRSMTMCRNRFGAVNFIFASHTDHKRFVDDVGVVSCGHFSVRQTALVNNYADLFIGVGSGISVATSCWGNKPTPKIQYTGSRIGSTAALANGPFELFEYDHDRNAQQNYFHKLVDMLDKL